MKRITAKVDEYTDQASGQKKGQYVEIGVIMQGDSGGEYCILNPHVDLAGVLIRQRIMNPQKPAKGVMCSIFSNEPQRTQNAPSGSPQRDPNFQDSDIPF